MTNLDDVTTWCMAFYLSIYMSISPHIYHLLMLSSRFRRFYLPFHLFHLVSFLTSSSPLFSPLIRFNIDAEGPSIYVYFSTKYYTILSLPYLGGYVSMCLCVCVHHLESYPFYVCLCGLFGS